MVGRVAERNDRCADWSCERRLGSRSRCRSGQAARRHRCPESTRCPARTASANADIDHSARGQAFIFFSWDPNVDIRNSESKVGPGIDVRGNGGYVILPPSRNSTGGAYQWDPNSPRIFAPAPPWLIMLAKAKKVSAYARAALERECKTVAAALPGTRNSTLNKAAFNLGQLIGGNALDEQEVRDRLFEAAETCRLVADDGATAAEATIDSGITAGKKQPRARPQPPVQSGVR